MHSQSDNELGQKQIELVNSFIGIKVRVILEFFENAPDEASLENENECAGIEESRLSLLGDLVLPSVWLVHAEQSESHEIFAKHDLVLLFGDLLEYLQLNRVLFLEIHGLFATVVFGHLSGCDTRILRNSSDPQFK